MAIVSKGETPFWPLIYGIILWEYPSTDTVLFSLVLQHFFHPPREFERSFWESLHFSIPFTPGLFSIELFYLENNHFYHPLCVLRVWLYRGSLFCGWHGLGRVQLQYFEGHNNKRWDKIASFFIDDTILSSWVEFQNYNHVFWRENANEYTSQCFFFGSEIHSTTYFWFNSTNGKQCSLVENQQTKNGARKKSKCFIRRTNWSNSAV